MKTSLLGGMCFALASLTATAASAETLVAIAGPMTGQYASAGDQIRQGAELAIADINAKGGVLGDPLKLVVGDDACDPKQAVAVANRMVSDEIKFMHGHWCSSSTIPASDIYIDAEIPVVTVSTNPKVTERGLDNIFRINGRDDQQGMVGGQYIATKFADANVAVIDDKSAYGKGLATEIAKSMKAAGKMPVMEESITAGERDYSTLITKLKAKGVTLMAYGGYHTEVGLILRQAKQAGLDLMVLGGDTMTNSELASIAGDMTDNVLFTFSPDPRKNETAKPVVEAFRKQKIEPEGYVLYAYAAMQMFDQAATKAKSTDYEDVRNALASNSFNTVLGDLSFDAKGDLKVPAFKVYRWHGSTYDYAE